MLEYETVLVMQGGGSLGAYECGVYKTLAKYDIKFDIIAGTSIGAINAAIIVGAKNDDKEPAKQLEDFWLDITPSVLPDNVRCKISSMYAATYGNPEAFEPLWFNPTIISNLYGNFLSFYDRPYLYSTRPLKRSLSNILILIS